MGMQRFDAKAALAALQAKSFDRTLVSIALAKGLIGAEDFAAAQCRGPWADTPDVPGLLAPAKDAFLYRSKAAVDPISMDAQWTNAAATFLEPIRAEAIVGRLLPFARRQPRSAGALERIVGAGAAWTAEGSRIPVSTQDFEFVTLPTLKVSGLVVATNDFIELAARDDQAAAQLANDLRGAVVEQLDTTFASADAAVAGTSPAGIALSATTVASTGSTVAQISADLRSMIAVLTGAGVSLRSAHWVMSEPAWALYRLLKVADDGGTLAGLPVIASSGAAGRVMLLAAEHLSIMFGDVVTIQASGEGDIELSDAPSSGATVNMFATNSVATRTLVYCNWSVGGPSDSGGSRAVASLTGASYA